jgi:hypothetical protein
MSIFSEQSNKCSDSIKCTELLEQQSKCWPLKKDCAVCS